MSAKDDFLGLGRALMEGPGITAPRVRRKMASAVTAATRGGRGQWHEVLPPELLTAADKLAQRPRDFDDADITALRKRYGEDGTFELLVVGAYTAGQLRVERGLQVLEDGHAS